MSNPTEPVEAWSPEFVADDTLQPDPGGSDVPPLEAPFADAPAAEEGEEGPS